MPAQSKAARYDVLTSYGASPGEAPADRQVVSMAPAWALAVVRLDRPLSYSRRTQRSMGTVVEGAFTRAEKPLLIVEDCTQLQIANKKASHLKQLSATLRYSGTDYLDASVLLPGDWVFAWILNSDEERDRVVARAEKLEACNGFTDGLRFVGRVHGVREQFGVDPGTGKPQTVYHLQALGFEELDTAFFYDFALGTSAAVSARITEFMAQIGLNFADLMNQEATRAGNLENNADLLIVALVNMILGKGVSHIVNRPIDRGTKDVASFDNVGVQADPSRLKAAPQANKEAPFAYLVPRAVGQLLGRDAAQASKGSGIFGYADVLETLVGVQAYEAPDGAFTEGVAGFYPVIDWARTTGTRFFTKEPLKSTFLPVNPTFTNTPLWALLQQYLNPVINEMYTALRVSWDGSVAPTLVVRQIPFSTEAGNERPEFPLTRFMALPRWVVDPVLVQRGDVGRSNAVRVNMMHVYGNAQNYRNNIPISDQITRNPPIFDEVDIQRSGMRARMATVNCAIQDQLRAPAAWMEAAADWGFGAQYTLNGTLECHGLVPPIAEGDNVEYHGDVYHCEGVTHSCGVADTGQRYWRTTLELSNGYPADQTGATADVPVYAGFQNVGRRTVRVEEDGFVTGEGADLQDSGRLVGVEETVAGGAPFVPGPPHGVGEDS